MPSDRRPASAQAPTDPPASESDLRYLRQRGLSESSLRRQLENLRRLPRHTTLLRACTRGDGIRLIRRADEPRLRDLWKQAAEAGRLLKLVPASGAATRMFGLLRRRSEDEPPGSRERLDRLAAAGDEAAAAVQRLLDDLARLPFAAELAAALAARDRDAAELARNGAYVPLLDFLLGEEGLGYGAAPKALIPFHRYATGPRTAFAEQLAESASYLADAGARCRLHFTVSEADKPAFAAALAAARQPSSGLPKVEYAVGFSTQDPATDTVAIDAAGGIARDEEGRILLRPAGHGALLGNLEALAADLVLVQNIDNVVPEERQEVVVRWKRLLVGQTVRLELELAALRRRLAADPAAAATDSAAALTRLFAVEPPPGVEGEELAAWTLARLDRPLRVCGMVPNAGEPGGGPFWVAGADGAAAGQIVEPPEVDREDPAQLEIWRSSTHFNPVNMVLSLRDPENRPYPLRPLVDFERYLVIQRRHAGAELRALERPGLWNGAMAGWNTCFVELPGETFNPVKTVFDLLRPEHQPEPS
jgi:hypothetical protein